MHPKLSLFPLGDRHLCLFRRRKDGRDPMKSPDMSVEMGNTGSVEIAFVSSRKKFIHVVGSFELAFWWLRALVSPFYPLTKEYTQPLILLLIKNTGRNTVLLNDSATLMAVVP